jgi:hypothetical protein
LSDALPAGARQPIRAENRANPEKAADFGTYAANPQIAHLDVFFRESIWLAAIWHANCFLAKILQRKARVTSPPLGAETVSLTVNSLFSLDRKAYREGTPQPPPDIPLALTTVKPS